MTVRYIVIEIWDENEYPPEDIYDMIVQSLGGGAEYSTDQSNLYYLMQRCAEDIDKVKVLMVGNPDEGGNNEN